MANVKVKERAPTAEGSCSGSATPGHEVAVVTINLEEVYDAVGGPESAASTILESLLKAWGARYKILCNSSPDVGDEYFDEEFENIAEALYGAYMEGEVDEDPYVLAALRVAERHNADAVIVLYDGYESAIAIAWRSECR